MLNGKKFGAGKPKMMFGNTATAVKTPDGNTEEQALNITAPSCFSDSIHTNTPIYGVFAFYKYYLMLGGKEDTCKYKAIVKFNLDHKKYFSKRDQIIEYVQNKQY